MTDTVLEIQEKIISFFAARGIERAEAVRNLDLLQSPTLWSSITNRELRDLIEKHHDARHAGAPTRWDL